MGIGDSEGEVLGDGDTSGVTDAVGDALGETSGDGEVSGVVSEEAVGEALTLGDGVGVAEAFGEVFDFGFGAGFVCFGAALGTAGALSSAIAAKPNADVSVTITTSGVFMSSDPGAAF